MNDIDYTYMYNTVYKSYVFAYDIDEVLKSTGDSFFEDNNFFDYIENEVKQNEEFEYLDNLAKENIFKILNFFRDYYKGKEKYIEYVDKINNMIIILNRSKEGNVYNFYQDEVISRSLYKEKVTKSFEKQQPKLLIPVIREMIVFDAYLVLKLFANHEEFLAEVDFIVKNPNTIYSLSKFFDEFPQIIVDPVINERIKLILKMSLNNSKNNLLDYRDSVKVMRKYIDTKKDN